MNPKSISSRRRFLGLSIGAFAVTGAAVGLPLAALAKEHRLVRRKLPIMGTIAEVVVVCTDGVDEVHASESIDSALDALRDTNRLMSRYEQTSDVGRANLAAAGTSIAVAPQTRYVLEQAKRWARATGGRFDPCLGGMTRLWDVTVRTTLPTQEELRQAELESPWSALELADDSIVLAHEQARLDLGGIAKGFAIDEAVRALREAGISHAFVNVGGDLFAMGASEDGDAWNVGVRNPAAPYGNFLTTLRLKDAAVATSGDYERFFDYDGSRYHHILGRSAQGFAPVASDSHSTTVRAESCLDADAAATALFGLEPTAAVELLAQVCATAKRIA